MPNNPLEVLHKTVTDSTSGKPYYKLGDFNSFVSNLEDPGKRKSFFDAVSTNYNLGDWEDFDSRVNKELASILEQDISQGYEGSPMVGSFMTGLAGFNASIMRTPALLYSVLNLPGNLLGAAGVPGMGGVEPPDWLADPGFAKYYDAQAQSADYMGKRWEGEDLVDVINRKNPLEIVEYLAHGVISNAPTQIPIIASAMAGVPWAGLALMGASSASQEYTTAKAEGASEIQAAIDAILSGAAEVGGESLGTVAIFNRWNKQLTEIFGEAGAKQVWGSVFKSIGSSAAGEGFEEVGTAAAQDAARIMTGVDPNAFEDWGRRYFEQGTIGGLSGGFMTGPSAISSGIYRTAVNMMDARKTYERASGTVTVKFDGYTYDPETGKREAQYTVDDSKDALDISGSSVNAEILRDYGLPIPEPVRPSTDIWNDIQKILEDVGIEKASESIAVAGLIGEYNEALGREQNNPDLPTDNMGIQTIEYNRGNPNITQPQTDLNVVQMLFGSPEFQLAVIGHKAASEMATDVVTAELKMKSKMSDHHKFFGELQGSLSKKEQKAVRGAMEKIYDLRRGNNIGNEVEINKILQTKEGKAAGELIKWFSSIREDIKGYKREVYKLKLSPTMFEAFEDWRNNPRAYAEVASAHGVEEADVKRVIEEYKDIDNWGIDEYITNIEVGNVKVYQSVLNEKGAFEEHIVAVRRNYKDAEKAARELSLQKPNAKFIIRTEEAGENPLEKTKGKLKGMENIFDALPTYAYRVERAMHIGLADQIMQDRFKKDNAKPFAERDYQPKAREALRKMVGAASGMYSKGDRAFNEFLMSGFGRKVFPWVRPFGYTRGIGRARSLEAGLKLGYRPVAAFVNKMGGQMHMEAALGARWLKQADAFLKTEDGQRFISDNEWALGMDFAMDVSGKVRQKMKLWEPLGLFQHPELGMRKQGLAAAYIHGRQALGLNHDEALREAGKFVRFALFTYNTSSMPEILRTPEGKLIGQFKSYMLKEIEFIQGLSPQQKARYFGYQMLFSGPRGFMHFMRSIPLLGSIGALDDLEKWLESLEIPENVPIVGGKNPAYGVIGAVTGTDITQAAVVQLATRPEDMAGPYLKDMFSLFRDVVGPAVYNSLPKGDKAKYDFMGERARNWALSTSPVYGKWYEFVDSMVSPDGWVQDRQGNRLYKVTNGWDKAMLIAGAYPIERTSKQRVLHLLEVEDRIMADNRKRLGAELARRLLREKPLVDLGRTIIGKIAKNERVPEEMMNGVADYLNSQYVLSEDMVDKMVAYGMLDMNAVERRLIRAKVTPEQRKFMRDNLLQKARDVGILDLESY